MHVFENENIASAALIYVTYMYIQSNLDYLVLVIFPCMSLTIYS